MAAPRRPSKALLEAAFRCIADGVTVQDAAGRILMANDAAARVLGFRDTDELVRTPVSEIMGRFVVMGEDRQPLPVDLWPSRLALREGRAAEALLGHRALPSGEERWSLTKSTPLRDEAGLVRAVVTVFQDMTERRRSADRLETLAAAGAALGSSLDYNATLTAVARLAVPRLADWCIVHVVADDGAIQPLALAHRDRS